jgi:hypothetical protein
MVSSLGFEGFTCCSGLIIEGLGFRIEGLGSRV